MTFNYFISHYFSCILPPVFVKLDSKIRHHAHGFIGQGHFHLDYPCTAGKRAGYLQTFSLDGWKPNLEGGKKKNALLRAISFILFNDMSPAKAKLTVLGGLYAPMGIPTLPPRSKRSSRPLLAGALKAGGTTAGGAPKPAPICRLKTNMLLFTLTMYPSISDRRH